MIEQSPECSAVDCLVNAMLCIVADISLVVWVMVSWWKSTSDNI